MSAPSRRRFLGHIAGAAAITTAAAGVAIAETPQADNPDAKLIGLCAEFDALEGR